MKKRFKNQLTLFLCGVNLLLDILVLFFICKVNVLPIKYIVLLFLFLVFFNILVFSVSLAKNKVFKIIGCVFTGIFLVCTIFIIHYCTTTDNFFNNSFSNLEANHENTYYLYVKDDIESFDNLHNRKIGYYRNTPNIDKALDHYDFYYETVEYENLSDVINAFNNNEIVAFIVEKTLYDMHKESTSESKINLDLFKKLDEFKISIKDTYESKSTADDIYNIYIGGLDFTETNTDFNMIITVNRNTHKILLTSIPRDYYVDVYGKDGKDLLGYAGIWSLGTSVQTIENLFGIDIDYYLRIHTTNLVDLVDALGGVEFCSNYGFTTTHALILGSYDDTHDSHLYVKSGCYNYSGIEILTIARERLQVGGDRVRQKNCQDIIINIFKKMASTNTLTHYDSILKKLGNTYTTNISRSVVEAVVRDTLDNPNVWTFEKQSVDGTSTMDYVHFSNYIDHVMYPDMDTVNEAVNKIKEVMGE